ncbi:MAG: DUF3783 domain-containing protein [Clostridiales bacterium]|nr:DUF3783 domain-containing protein [Candidatus Cacconaster stercorequi]
MKPTVLLFNIPPRKQGTIRVLAMRLRLRVLVAAPEHFAAPLEKVLQGEADAMPAASFSEEMLVMAGLPDAVLELFLKGLRQQKATVALKAVLTDTNRCWSAVELHQELRRERDAITAGETAHQM